MRFAGFKSCSTLPRRRRLPSLARLGRSGTHVQVCLTLFSIREYPLHALPRDADPVRTPRWETHSAVVYLHFDLLEGTALWLLVSPRSYHAEKGNGTQNLLWNTLNSSLTSDLAALAHSNVHERLRVSLGCLLAAARWSVGMFSHHLQDTERRLSDLVSRGLRGSDRSWLQHANKIQTKPYVYPFDDDDMVDDEPRESIHAQDLRRMAFLMESRHGSVMRVENNLRVLRNLRKFLVDEVCRDLGDLGNGHTDNIRMHIEDFAEHVTLVIEEIEDLLDRALALDKLAKNREEYIQRLQAHHSSQQTKTIAELTADDSSAMKQLSFVALILLPVTVVSAVLSTDIVKFQGLESENEKNVTGSTSDNTVPIFNFSVAAFGTWAVASVLMTIATLLVVKPMGSRGRRSNGSVGGGGGGGEDAVACTWASQMKRWASYAWNFRDAPDSAEKKLSRSNTARPGRAASAFAASIHTAPTVTKTASISPEAPMVDEGVPAPAETPRPWTSMGRWLGAAVWDTMWHTAKDRSDMTAAATTPLPRWDSRRDGGPDEVRDAGQKPPGIGFVAASMS
ncbi:telomerase reverse transcriptase [Colletotrichum tofieldiae]|nr:telomerase reverse transcriptase [Colletotrichum tofieldiae]